MEKIVVRGGDNRLVGSVTIEGAKKCSFATACGDNFSKRRKNSFKKMFLSYRMSLP